MRTTLIWVLLVAVIFCEGRRGRLRRILSRYRRRRPPPAPVTTKAVPTTTPTPKADIIPVGINSFYNVPALRKINSTQAFYDYFKKIPRNGTLPDGRIPGRHSTAVNTDGSVWACKVRPTLVSLPVPQFGVQIFPPCVLLNRCTGCCLARDLVTCKPREKKMTAVEHYTIYMPTGNPWDISYVLGSTLMEEHVKCGCECIKTAESCDPKKHDWDENSCSCNCKPEYQESVVKCPHSFKFDKDKCGCVCNKAEKVCPNPLHEWNVQECGCACKFRPTCRGRQVLDKDTCKCK